MQILCNACMDRYVCHRHLIERLGASDMKYSTIASYISSFSHYFKENNLDNLTNSISFKNFKSGLRRELEGDKFPNAKQPFQPEWFEQIIDTIGVNTFDNRLFMFYMTISFCAFLRISELVELKKSDFEITQNYLSINIASSKTDQFGKGTKTYPLRPSSSQVSREM